MKPFINLDELDEFNESCHGTFQDRYASFSKNIGAKKLDYGMAIVPPGKKLCPFHNHRIGEEMFLILEGEGTLRYGEEEYSVKKHDVIACPPGGPEVAHQLINTGNSDLKYLCLSTHTPHEICEYPDSNKVLVAADGYNHLSKLADQAEYYEGEE